MTDDDTGRLDAESVSTGTLTTTPDKLPALAARLSTSGIDVDRLAIDTTDGRIVVAVAADGGLQIERDDE